MQPSPFQVHKFWLLRAASVLVVTAVVEGLVGQFAPRPAFWAALVASSLPLTMILFVALPLLRREERG